MYNNHNANRLFLSLLYSTVTKVFLWCFLTFPPNSVLLYVGLVRLTAYKTGIKAAILLCNLTKNITQWSLKFTHQAVTLFGSCATTCTKKMTAFTRIWAKTSALPTLWATVHLGKPLTILRAFTPASMLAAIVAGWTRPLRQWKVIHKDILGFWACDDLVPVDGLDMTEVVVVEQTHTSSKNICKTI